MNVLLMFKKNVLVNAVATSAMAAMVILSLASGAVSAASQCKGLDSAACATQESCGWVEGYQRQDGRKVNAFCRASQKGKTKKSVSSNAKSGDADTETS